MTNLEQLIQRIEYPLKVSTEDALDVIQQYWDDAANTVSKYWNGTDEEIAEEVGISKQSLSEILDQHGNGQAYANLGGNSGVDSYVEGYGWIMVNFTTGAKYLYTTKSTTDANIEQMKQYAHEGKGLNSYIMRICRDGYAGNNINGAIQVRPGMEQYTNEANKRLRVLYAFRNAQMSTVSNEGIGDLIKNIGRFITGKDEHGVRKDDKKPGKSVTDHSKWYTDEGKKEWDKLKDTLTRFYMNSNWLDNQTLVTGALDAKDIASAFVFNGQLGNDPLGNVDKGIQYRLNFGKTWYPHVKVLADQANKIFKQLERDTVGAKNTGEAGVELVRKTIKTLEALPEPLDKLPVPSSMGLGNLIPAVGKHGNLKFLTVKVAKEPTTNGKLPALNKEQIKHAAELILKLLDWDPVMEYISWPDHGDGSKLSDWIYDEDNDVYMELYDRFDQQGCDQKYVDAVRRLIDSHRVAAALETWIDMSIQQKDSKMNKVSNEGIFESIRKMFSGKDKPTEQPKFDGYIWDKAIAIEKSPPKQLNPTVQTSPIFQLNGKYNPNWISRLEADIKQYERLAGTLKQADVKLATWAKKWRKQLATFNGNNDKPAEFLVAARQFIKEQPTPFSEVFTNTYEYLGYGKDSWMEGDNFVYSKMFAGSRVDLPELDASDTKKIVDIIIKLGRLILIGDAEDFSYVAFDLTDAPFRGYSGNDDIDEVLNNLRYDGHSSVTPRDCYEVIDHRIEDILNALIKYVHDAQASDIGNEAICQATARKYSKLLDQAGSDGLDSVARQLMSVGLEHIKVEDVHVHPYTQVASVEGIWDSIKDFFAGRPVKIHLSGTDRNLRSKLDRSINDRVWLSRQKYTLGEVKYRALEGFNVETAGTFVRDYVQSVSATSQHNKREMAKIRERLEAVPRVLKLYISRTMTDTRLLDAAIADINPYAVRLNINLKEPDLLALQMGPQVGPALTKIEVKQFAEYIATVHATQVNFENSIWVNPTLNYMANIQFRYSQLPQGPSIIRKAQQAMDAYTQVVMMVNREIKQRITTHAAWINAENIADSLVNYIGKSLTNVTTNSLESFNPPWVPSNEELSGTVKKFFTDCNDVQDT